MWKVVLLAACLAFAHGASMKKRAAEPLEDTLVNHKLLEIKPVTEAQTQVLRDLENSGLLGLDFWLPIAQNHATRVRVPPNVQDRFSEILHDYGMTSTVIWNSIQDLIDNPPVHTHYDMSKYIASQYVVDHTKYNTMDEINADMLTLANQYSGVQRTNLQYSTSEGRTTYALEITGGTGSNKKEIIIEAGIHAREWVSPAATMYFVEEMLKGRDVPGSAAEKLYRDFNWFIVPVTNPDGYVYTHSTSSNRLWRKNRSRACSGSSARGVDLNRNFAANFGGPGSSSNCFSDIYRGPNSFSEAESLNMQKLEEDVRSRFSQVEAYLSVHSYSQFLLVPYAWNRGPPHNDESIREITGYARTAIQNYQGRNYQVGTAPELLNYEASGGSGDWAHLIGIPYTMTYELRPAAGTSNGFVLPPEEIIPTGEEMLRSIIAITNEL